MYKTSVTLYYIVRYKKTLKNIDQNIDQQNIIRHKYNNNKHINIHGRWPPERKVVGSSPTGRTSSNFCKNNGIIVKLFVCDVS